MPHVGSEVDANFYQLIHRMLESPRGPEGHDRRSEERRAFRAAQRIAPWDDGRFPDDREFVSIQCHDLTRRGFSFLAASVPPFSNLIVEFDAQPEPFYVGARVLHCDPVVRSATGQITRSSLCRHATPDVAPQSRTEKPLFLVGCRFTRRLQKPA